jgi:transposase
VLVGERSAILEIEEGGLRVGQRSEAVVVGRKNHYGSKSKRGTEVAALFYTLFETAKLSGIDPRAYIALAAKRAITDHGAVTLPSDLT